MILNPRGYFTTWGFGGGFAAPEFLFLVLRPGFAGAQHQKTKVMKRIWYETF